MVDLLLDTNVWNALISGDPVARPVLEMLGDGLALVSDVALAELASLEARTMVGSDPIGKVLSKARVLPLTTEAAVEAGRLHGKLRRGGNAKVSLADVLMYVCARRAGALFVTFDPDLKGRPGVRFVKA